MKINRIMLLNNWHDYIDVFVFMLFWLENVGLIWQPKLPSWVVCFSVSIKFYVLAQNTWVCSRSYYLSGSVLSLWRSFSTCRSRRARPCVNPRASMSTSADSSEKTRRFVETRVWLRRSNSDYLPRGADSGGRVRTCGRWGIRTGRCTGRGDRRSAGRSRNPGGSAGAAAVP